MNIYQKLQTCRVQLQKSAVKKSGENKFSNYDYFELADFLPRTNELFLENGLCGIVYFGESDATLTIRNIDKPEEEAVTFRCPNAEVTLKGCHAIQNMGAAQTYQRRYLYMAAMEIVENDIIDKTTDTKETKPEPKPRPVKAKEVELPKPDTGTMAPDVAWRRKLLEDILEQSKVVGLDTAGLKLVMESVTGKTSSLELTIEDIEAIKNELTKHQENMKEVSK